MALLASCILRCVVSRQFSLETETLVKRNLKQECIPVGCVPSTAVGVSGNGCPTLGVVCLGELLAWEGTFPGGVCLRGGGCLRTNFSIGVEFLGNLHKLDRNYSVGIKRFERNPKIVTSNTTRLDGHWI